MEWLKGTLAVPGRSILNAGGAYLTINDALCQLASTERAYQERDITILSMKSEWLLEGVRSDPRYIDLLQRLGLD